MNYLSKQKTNLILLLCGFLLLCVSLTEKETCERWGCEDTGNKDLVLFCPGYIELANFDCKNFGSSFRKYKTEEECLQKINPDRDGFLVGCLLGIRDTENLNGKSEIPLSGGWCLFNC